MTAPSDPQATSQHYSLPCHNGAAAWHVALSARRSGLRYAYVMGMLGGTGRLAFGAPWNGRAAGARTATALRALGCAAETITPEEAERRLQNYHLPLPWFGRDREGILLAVGREGFEARWIGTDGMQCVGRLMAADLKECDLYGVRATVGAVGTRLRREAEALADWAAAEMMPPLAVSARRRDRVAWEAEGLSAYDLWADWLEDAARVSMAEERARILRWLDARRCGAAFLRGLAARQRTPYAIRLGRAAALFEQEVAECLEPARLWLESGRRRRREEAASLLRSAEELATEAVAWVLDAALRGLHLPPPLRAALSARAEEPLAGAPLQETIYLARAGTRPLRRLAARRLAGAGHPQAIATLAQLLYDPDLITAETAVWALETLDPNGLPGLLASAFANVALERPGSARPLQLSLLHALSHLPGPAAESTFKAAAESEDARVRRMSRESRV